MENYKLLTTLAFVAGLFLASAEEIEYIDSLEPIDVPLPFKFLRNEESAWDGSLASPHIAGGSDAVPHSHPHQVLLIIKGTDKKGEKKGGFCGGSLLSESWVITAAHCADKSVIFRDIDAADSDEYKLNLIAAVGVHNAGELFSHKIQGANVSEIVIHPKWSTFAIKNDIALLKLEKDFVLNEYVQTIRLPKLSQKGELFEGAHVTMTGWGVVKKGDKKPPKALQTVDSTVVSNLYCKFRYLFLLVQDTNICVSGRNGKGTCKGDSGGPLIIKEADGEPTLIGITSFGFGCTWGFPQAFTRVTSFLEWIYSTTGLLPRN